MRYFKILVPALLAGAVVACGGSGGGTTPPAASVNLTGTAAAGAPIIGTVTVKGSLGVTTSALIEADGNYDVDVSDLTAPYRLRAEGTVGGRTYKLHSYAVADDLGKNVNITPFTDLIIANVAGQIAESYFDNDGVVPELASADIVAQEAELQEKLKDVFAAVGLDTAINLLNSTFSTDHSGLDAALDIVNITVDAGTNIATITNLVENTTIEDSVVTTGETDVLEVVDATKLTTSVSDTQAIAQAIDAFEAAFATGLPTAASIQDYLADDFLEEDNTKGQFLTQVTTDPGMIGLTLSGITVTNLNSTAGTAEVTFSFGLNGVLEIEPVKWFMAKHATLGWQARGDQRIVETDFSFHCNDNDAADSFAGACGVNTQFWDNNFTNNGTGGAAIASGTVKIIDQTDSSVKATIYLGTPPNGTAGDVQVYNPASAANTNVDQRYQGDWFAFGASGVVGVVDPAVFVPGDTIEYTAYTADLVLTDPAAPAVTGASVVTYTDTVLFAPENVLTKMPTATATTITAISDFTLGNNLTVAWNLVPGTRIEEILVEITDSAYNRIEIWDWILGTTATSKTFSSSSLSATAASQAGLLDSDTTYSLKVRIYAKDVQTGQSHSRDYNTTIPGPAATSGGGTAGTALSCNYQTPWDDTNDVPLSYNSFTDFETVIADCGNEVAITSAALIGTWTETYAENNGTTTATNIFSVDGTGTWSDNNTVTGAGDTGTFNWVIQNGRLELTGTGSSAGFIDVGVLSSDGIFRFYSEDSFYGNTPDLIADGTADGFIFSFTMTKQ